MTAITRTDKARISLAFSEGIANLLAELELAFQWERPSILIAVYRTESVRDKAEKALDAALGKKSQRIERVQIGDSQTDLLQALRRVQDPERAVFSVTGLRHGGGRDGRNAYQFLNLNRETFVEQRYRTVFWLTEAEAKNLPHLAPDFWAFRHRVVEFALDRLQEKDALPSGALLWHISGTYIPPGKMEEEIHYYHRVLADLPKTSEAASMRLDILFNLAHLAWLHGDLDRVVKDITNGIALAGELEDPHFQGKYINALGIIQYQFDNKLNALSFFQQSGKLNPQDGIPITNLAITYLAVGQRRNAVNTSQKAARLEVRNPRIWNAIGHLYLAGGHLEAAQSSFEQALSLDHRNPLHYTGLAVCQFHAGEIEKARQTIRRIDSLDCQPRDYFLACQHAIQGDIHGAVRILKEALATNVILSSSLARDPILRYILDRKSVDVLI